MRQNQHEPYSGKACGQGLYEAMSFESLPSLAKQVKARLCNMLSKLTGKIQGGLYGKALVI
jgi:hypothetical protein